MSFKPVQCGCDFAGMTTPTDIRLKGETISSARRVCCINMTTATTCIVARVTETRLLRKSERTIRAVRAGLCCSKGIARARVVAISHRAWLIELARSNMG